MKKYSTLKIKEILQYAAIPMNLVDIMLLKILSQKIINTVLILVLRVVKYQRQKVELWFPRGGELWR